MRTPLPFLLLLPLAGCAYDAELAAIEAHTRELMELPAQEREELAPETEPVRQVVQTYHPENMALAGQWTVLLHPDGTVEKDGVDERWYPDGQLASRRHYHLGRPAGEWETWHPNGRLESSLSFHLGQETTEAQWWHDDGTRASAGPMRRGTRHGEWTYWHPGGHTASEAGVYDNGLRAGLWRAWWPDGTPRYEGHFEHNRRVGDWVLWDRHGGRYEREGPAMEVEEPR